jgi:predicted transcriptional regulator
MARVEYNILSARRHAVFGPLEWQVLEIIWKMKQCSVNDVVHQLPEGRAYTTIMTTLSRLHQKGILMRSKDAKKYFYSPRLSCQELKDTVVQDIIALLLEIKANSQESIICSLFEGLRRQDPTLFDKVVNSTTKTHEQPADLERGEGVQLQPK